LLSVQTIDRDERVDLRRREIVDPDRLARETPGSAVDRPPEDDPVDLLDDVAAVDPPAARGQDRLDVGTGETERRRAPADVEDAGARLTEGERRRIEPVRESERRQDQHEEGGEPGHDALRSRHAVDSTWSGYRRSSSRTSATTRRARSSSCQRS